MVTDAATTEPPGSTAPAPFRRWAVRLFVGYLAVGALAIGAMLASITAANAGYPALFLLTLFVAVSLPVWIVVAALAAISLVRREPGPRAAWIVLIACAAAVWAFGDVGIHVVRGLLRV
jgi:hypothetical protein